MGTAVQLQNLFGVSLNAAPLQNPRSKAHEQKAIALLQKNIRGAITRKRIQKELKAGRAFVNLCKAVRLLMRLRLQTL